MIQLKVEWLPSFIVDANGGGVCLSDSGGGALRVWVLVGCLLEVWSVFLFRAVVLTGFHRTGVGISWPSKLFFKWVVRMLKLVKLLFSFSFFLYSYLDFLVSPVASPFSGGPKGRDWELGYKILGQ